MTVWYLSEKRFCHTTTKYDDKSFLLMLPYLLKKTFACNQSQYHNSSQRKNWNNHIIKILTLINISFFKLYCSVWSSCSATKRKTYASASGIVILTNFSIILFNTQSSSSLIFIRSYFQEISLQAREVHIKRLAIALFLFW